MEEMAIKLDLKAERILAGKSDKERLFSLGSAIDGKAQKWGWGVSFTQIVQGTRVVV